MTPSSDAADPRAVPTARRHTTTSHAVPVARSHAADAQAAAADSVAAPTAPSKGAA
ncbi:hypothetical protein [Actinocatenispora thailandica]|uniref:hypothetical protein n=1 Tax=Actinocatenispora thailandica TaxID=227318 RepID=UPI001950FD26|nr:hypothetical protein [Actinocatenispora thailandica]